MFIAILNEVEKIIEEFDSSAWDEMDKFDVWLRRELKEKLNLLDQQEKARIIKGLTEERYTFDNNDGLVKKEDRRNTERNMTDWDRAVKLEPMLKPLDRNRLGEDIFDDWSDKSIKHRIITKGGGLFK